MRYDLFCHRIVDKCRYTFRSKFILLPIHCRQRLYFGLGCRRNITACHLCTKLDPLQTGSVYDGPQRRVFASQHKASWGRKRKHIDIIRNTGVKLLSDIELNFDAKKYNFVTDHWPCHLHFVVHNVVQLFIIVIIHRLARPNNLVRCCRWTKLHHTQTHHLIRQTSNTMYITHTRAQPVLHIVAATMYR